MSSIRDKINSKLNISPPFIKPTSQILTSYDETNIKIKVVSGLSQLCSIKLDCTWLQSTVNQKCPQLSCKWFNKTQNAMTLIQGVNGSYYQPCLHDIGTIIYIQCLPELPGVDYQGMPIIRQIGPIILDTQTQQQAIDLLNAGKATFSTKIKTVNDQTLNQDALIKIQGNIFRLITKKNEQQIQLINQSLTQNNPIFKCIRSKQRQLQIFISNSSKKQTHKILIQLTNNVIRDLLVLFTKLILAKNDDEDKNINNNISNIQLKNLQQLPQKYHQQQTKNINSTKTNQHNNNNQSPTKSPQNHKQIKNIDQHTQPLQSNIPSTPPHQTKTLQDTNQSPKKSNINQLPSSPLKQKNALQTLQIADLKKQLRINQGQILNLKKQLKQKNQSLYTKQQEVNIMKQRQSSLNKNYFQLQTQLTKTKTTLEKLSQQLSYYKNQNILIKSQNQAHLKKNKILQSTINNLQSKLKPFQLQSTQNTPIQNYLKIKQKYTQQLKSKSQLQIKYQLIKQETQKIQDKYHQIVDQLNNQKNFYKKKYQNLTQQFQSHNPTNSLTNLSPLSPLKLSKLPSPKSLDQPTLQHHPQSSPSFSLSTRLQQQLLQVKKQLKQALDQNNFLHTINIRSEKDKKSTSKYHLKLQLVQMKKIISQLTQALTQKNLALQHMKNINKQISQQLLAINKKFNLLQQGEKNILK